MFQPNSKSNFTLTIGDAPHDFQVQSFTCKEAISTPYCVEIQRVGKRLGIDLDSAPIAFNTGGDAGVGTPSNPLMPGVPMAAAEHENGQTPRSAGAANPIRATPPDVAEKPATENTDLQAWADGEQGSTAIHKDENPAQAGQ